MASVSKREELSRFREANECLGDSNRIKARFEEDGYLFLRQVLNRQEVETVKHDFIHVLQGQGVVRAGVTEAVWTGLGVDRIDELELYAQQSTSKLLDSAQTMRLLEGVFGETVFMFKSQNIRYAIPDDAKHVTPPHQDYFFIRINQSFRTLWIPLMDIDEEVGGLVLAGGSHKRGLLDHVEQEAAYSYIFKGRKQRGIALGTLPQPWLTTDYHPGDLLIFSNLMVHWALPNRSDRIRLSIDNRCQPMTAPRTWQAEMPILEARRIRQTAKQIADDEGASEAQFESIMIELMKRGWEPEKGRIKTLMAELPQ